MNPDDNYRVTIHDKNYYWPNHVYESGYMFSKFNSLKPNSVALKMFDRTDTIMLKKSRYDCFEDNSMNSKDCINELIAEEIGCKLPWEKTTKKFQEKLSFLQKLGIK